MLKNGSECGKNKGNETLKATISATNYDRSKTSENVEYFNNLGSKIPNDARCTCAFKSRTAMVKGHSAGGKAFLHPKIGF